MKLLHIDSSILGDASVSRQLTQAIVAQLKSKHANLEVEYLDVDQQQIPHLSGPILMGQDPEQSQLGEKLVQQYLDADIIVVGAAMYNFSLPSTLKAWIDRICVAGKTFRYTENGPEGLAGGKKIYIASSRGGVYGENSPADFQEAYLKTVFGFTGVTDVEVIRSEGVAMAEHKDQAIADAMAKIQAL